MRKKLIYSVVMGLVFILGSQNALGQAEYEKYVKSETPDSSILLMADEVLALEMDDAEKATKLIEKLYKKVQKKPYQMIGLSNYFLQKKSIPTAKMTAERAYKLFPEDPSVMIQLGDIYQSIRAYGKATQYYDEALSKDPENLYAMTMAAYLYKDTNPAKCVEYLQMMDKVAPSSVMVSRYLGDIYYGDGQNDKALENYVNYYKIVPHDIDNLNENSCINYVALLRMNEKYDEVETLSTELNGVFPKNTFFKRSIIDAIISTRYANLSEEDINRVIEKSDFVINNELPDTSYNYRDYAYLAEAYKAKQEYDEYIKWAEKAIQKEPRAATTLLPEIADAYSRAGNYDKAIEMCEKFIATGDTLVQPTDYFFLAGYYGNKALKLEGAEQEAALAKAEEIYDNYETMVDVDEQYRGTFMMAEYYNALQNTDKMVEYFVFALNKMGEPNDVNKAHYVRANKMLLGVETDKDSPDVASIKKYCSAILSVDPEDEFANNVNEILKQNGL